MRLIWSSQYNINCVVAERGDTGEDVIDRCRADDAVLFDDGVEFCVQLRDEVGPELWTEESLRKSLRLRV